MAAAPATREPVRYFVTVARSSSISAAARILHVSQPSLGVQIKQLEDNLGTPLLLRHRHGVELTEAGTAFLSHAIAALEEIKRAERAVAAFNPSRSEEISLGVTPTPGRALIGDLLRKCREMPRSPKLVFREGLSDELWRLVAEGELDAGFCYDPTEAPTIRIFPLYREDLVLVGSPKVLKSVGDAPGTFLGLLFLFSAKDATPVAMINDGILQHYRVGGGAGLGVKYLSRPDSSIVGMIGSGGMARTYLDAFCQVRKIRKIKVWSPNKENERNYAREMAERHGLDAEPATSAREAVRGVDIVSCCTSTNEPVFFNQWLEPGMHVTNLTSSEIESTLPKMDVAVRAGEVTPRLGKLPPEADYFRAGFLGYVAGSPEERELVPKLTLPPEIINMPPLVDLLAGRAWGRTDDKQTSFFLNVGAIGAQFEGVVSESRPTA